MLKRIVISIFLLGFALAACSTGTLAGSSNPLPNLAVTGLQQAQASNAPTANIIVNGTGRVFVKPDIALVTLGADSTKQTLADATADVSKRISAVLAQVKGMGVSEDDIKTTSYSITPQYNQQRGSESPSIIGYRVSNLVQVKVRKIDDVGKIVDAAVNAGANSLGGLYFTIDDSSKAEADARKLAVKNAMDKAKQLTDAAGVKLGDLNYISENLSTPRPEVFRLAAAAPAADAGIGPVQSGQLEVSVTVEMHYTISR